MTRTNADRKGSRQSKKRGQLSKVKRNTKTKEPTAMGDTDLTRAATSETAHADAVSNTNIAKAAAEEVKRALRAVGDALKEMSAATTKAQIDAAYAKVGAQVTIAQGRSTEASDASKAAETAEAEDAADRAADDADKAKRAVPVAKELLDRRGPTLPH
jgi:hypothetical protein